MTRSQGPANQLIQVQKIEQALRRVPKGAKLAVFANMPVDVLMNVRQIFAVYGQLLTVFLFTLQVLAYLTPAELLRLARSTKWLNALLTHKRTAAACWDTAVCNSGLPRCPTFMNHLAYAELVFGYHCQMCGKEGKMKMWYHSHIRVCGLCWKSRWDRLFKHNIIDLKRCLRPIHFTQHNNRCQDGEDLQSNP